MASAYLSRTPSSASNRRTWTWSGWVKRGSLSDANQVLFEAIDGSGFVEKLQFTASDILEYDHDIAGTDYTVYTGERKYRDTNAWYHIIFAKDTTQSTEADRIKIYVNGEQQSLSEYQLGYPPQNYEGIINNNLVHCIGSNNGSEYFNGLMTHVNFVDGTALTPTSFGQSDSNGVWIPKPSPSVTYGTNGYFLKMDNSGNMGLDSGGGSNNFTTSGTITQAKDTPSNVFATLNPLVPSTSFAGSFSNGNTTVGSSSSAKGIMMSTLGASSGKYYFEAKATSGSAIALGITNDEIGLNSWSPSTGNYVLYNSNGIIQRPSNSPDSGTTYTTNDIIGVAWNATDSEVTFYKNGTAINSGTAYSVEGTQGTMFFALGDTGTSSNPTTSFNFGNGYFGTTAVTSAGANASGNGIFEYDVPTGYTALSTKGLNS